MEFSPELIAVIVAVIGILKGKDVWDYLKSRNENKNKGAEKVIEVYEKQLENCEKKVEKLTGVIEKKITKSRGKKI